MVAAGKRHRDRRVRRQPVAEERRKEDKDRRQHERVLVDLEVDYRCEDTFLFAYTTDISATGICLQTRTPQKPGTRLNRRLGDATGQRLELEGEVMWVKPYPPGV